MADCFHRRNFFTKDDLQGNVIFYQQINARYYLQPIIAIFIRPVGIMEIERSIGNRCDFFKCADRRIAGKQLIHECPAIDSCTAKYNGMSILVRWHN